MTRTTARTGPKVALYTAIYGDPPYDLPKPLPADWPSSVPAVLFTDNPTTARAARRLGWTARTLREPRPAADRQAHPTHAAMMRHKYLKTHPAEAVDADVSLWIDGSMTISVDRYVERCLDALGDDDAVFVSHPWRTCIYDEAAYSATLPRYADCAVALDEQAGFYRGIGHPARWGLFATGANVRRHTDTAVELGRHWWYECVARTWQDQVSLPVLVRILSEDRKPPLRWNTNMPWHGWWTITPHQG